MSADLFEPPTSSFEEHDLLIRRAHLLREIERPFETPRRRPIRKTALIVALAGLIAVGAAVVPARIGHDRAGLIDRAIAAIGTGRTTHVVLVGPAARHVDLVTGKTTPQLERDEIWADPKLGIIEKATIGGKPLPPIFVPRSPYAGSGAFFERFVNGYRAELANGDFHPVGKATIGGHKVEWIADRPSPIDDDAGVQHLVVDEVAISEKTFKPLYLRTRVDGAVQRDSWTRVLTAETVAAPAKLFANRFKFSETPPYREAQSAPRTTLTAARAAMSPRPVVPPKRLAGLRRTWVGLPRIFVGPLKALRRATGVELFYGPTNFLGQPIDGGSFISITEFPHANAFVRALPQAYPTSGAMISGHTASLKTHGLYLIIRASSAKKAIAAAQALAR
jgi:hypothetical protein